MQKIQQLNEEGRGHINRTTNEDHSIKRRRERIYQLNDEGSGFINRMKKGKDTLKDCEFH